MWPKWPGSSWAASWVAWPAYQTTTSVSTIDSPLTNVPMFASYGGPVAVTPVSISVPR